MNRFALFLATLSLSAAAHGCVATAGRPASAWLTLAMATTLAGNLTLLGSVANLIVAEIAARRGVKLTLVEYLKAGTPIAIFTLLVGVAWLSR